MRNRDLSSLRNGLLTALGLVQACGGQAEPEATEAASALTSGAGSPAPATKAGPALSCARMAADDTYADNCWQSPRYRWNGARCEALRCGCAGNECGAVFSSVMSCYGERGVCDPLAVERAACIARNPQHPNDAGALPVSAECLSEGGTSCDSASFLSEAAAVCVAKLEGMADGLAPWGTNLYYNSGLGRVAWGVMNTTSNQADGSSGGTSLAIDATTGFVLEASAWSAIPGRPFLVDHTPRTAEATRRADYCSAENRADDSAATGPRLDGIAAEQRAALAAAWTRMGLLEHASVAAFARFALQLLGLAAPPPLLEACQQAMADELRHTRMAFGLASAYAETPLGPGRLNLEHALDTSGGELLAHVATTTLIEGCIGETIAALAAREAASHATDPYVRHVLATIAGDEERHAELAWCFLDWALGERPSLAPPLLAAAHARLGSAAARRSALQVSSPVTDEPTEPIREAELLQHGILPLQQQRELEAQALEQVIVPCLAALATKHAAPKAPSPARPLGTNRLSALRG